MKKIYIYIEREREMCTYMEEERRVGGEWKRKEGGIQTKGVAYPRFVDGYDYAVNGVR